MSIDHGEPRAALDFESANSPGSKAGWRESLRDQETYGMVRLPMALHSNGWLQTQVARVPCSRMHALMPQRLLGCACCWLGHSGRMQQPQTGCSAAADAHKPKPGAALEPGEPSPRFDDA